MNNDLEMYYAETDTPAVVRTMTLNEELGTIFIIIIIVITIIIIKIGRANITSLF